MGGRLGSLLFFDVGHPPPPPWLTLGSPNSTMRRWGLPSIGTALGSWGRTRRTPCVSHPLCDGVLAWTRAVSNVGGWRRRGWSTTGADLRPLQVELITKSQKMQKGITNPYSPRRHAMPSHTHKSSHACPKTNAPLIRLLVDPTKPPSPPGMTQIVITVSTTTKNHMITGSSPSLHQVR